MIIIIKFNSPNFRPLSMRVKHIKNEIVFSENNHSDVFAVIEKPFKYMFCCLCRHIITTKIKDNIFGTVVVPFTCCNLNPLLH